MEVASQPVTFVRARAKRQTTCEKRNKHLAHLGHQAEFFLLTSRLYWL